VEQDMSIGRRRSRSEAVEVARIFSVRAWVGQ
jgi:hypothetical protein